MINRFERNQLGVLNWEEFEKAVKAILESTGASLKNFRVNGKEKIVGIDGEYEIDGNVQLEILGGAKFFVIFECRSKKPGNKVERDELLAFQSKISSLRAQKGIFFTTSGFQKGAIEFAMKNSIALVLVTDGKMLYVTKGVDRVPLPSWVPKYAGWLVGLKGDNTLMSLIRPDIRDEVIK